MSTPRFISDPHLGHRNIYKYRTVFESTAHNDLYFKYVLEELCTKRDSMIFLGDVAFTTEYLDFIKSLPGRKILIPGNHCTEYIPMKQLVEVFDEVHALLKYKNFWLSHAPIHPEELRGKLNVHGHVHASSVPDTRYLNVSVDSEFMKFLPRTLDEVRKGFEHMNSTGKHFGGISDKEIALEVIMSNPLSKAAYEHSLTESRKTKIIL